MERDAARGYSINIKQVVFAFAIEFLIIGLILTSQYLIAVEQRTAVLEALVESIPEHSYVRCSVFLHECFICAILAGMYNVRVTIIHGASLMSEKQITFTSTANWDKYCDSGDNRFLDDAASLGALAKGTQVVIAGEGWERVEILA
jgi:hypothetical protein